MISTVYVPPPNTDCLQQVEDYACRESERSNFNIFFMIHEDL